MLTGSPCIDAGDNLSVVDTVDFDGNVRIFDGNNDGQYIVDMGPYEYNSPFYELHNMGISQWVSPGSGCSLGSNEIITIRVKNYGTMAENGFTLSYSIDSGQTWHSQTYAASIAPGYTATYSFPAGADFSANGTYHCFVAVNLLSDTISGNDTLYKVINRMTSLSGSLSHVAPTCDQGDGMIVAEVNSGTAPYTFLWSNGATNDTIENLNSGIYRVTITDANNCFVVLTDTLPIPGNIVITANIQNVLCHGTSSGYISLHPANGVAPYTFLWSNLTGSDSITNLSPGQYLVTVTDAANCYATAIYTITEPDAITAIVTGSPLICSASATGSIEASASGGIAPYVYNWSNMQSAPEITGLTAGQYQVTITDANGCTIVESYAIGEYPVVYTGSITGPQLVAAGATSNYFVPYVTGSSYQWSVVNGAIINGQGSNYINVFWNTTGGGELNAVRTDANGCTGDTSVLSITIQDPCAGIVPSVSFVSPSCTGMSNGSASITISGGTPPYLYEWSTGSHSYMVTGLASGTYGVTVNDAAGCVITQNVVLLDPSPLAVSVNTSPSACLQATGQAAVVVSGGTPAYTIVWSNGAGGNSTHSLPAGIHQVNVTDANGCTASAPVYISDNNAPVITLQSMTQLICPGAANGNINISIDSPQGSPSILWSTGQNTEDLSGLDGGLYELVVTAPDGCIAVAEYSISEPESPAVHTMLYYPSCNVSDGSIAVEVTGTESPYTLNWGSQTGDSISGLAAGIYHLTITDVNSCTYYQEIELNNINGAVLATDSIVNAECGNNVGAVYVTITAGTPPYNFEWSNGSTTEDLTGLASGTYLLTVTDNTQCQTVLNATVGINAPQLQPLCLVLVDSVMGKNMVVWEKVQQTGIDYYNVYRESSLGGQYMQIASLPYAAMSEYIDPTANPVLRSYRYKVSAVDECGNEGPLSTAHKTIHLTVNQGTGGTMNLIWDNYEGFPFNGYRIMRYRSSTGWTLVDMVPNTIFTYTDFPTGYGQVRYRMEVIKDDPCFPTSESKDVGGPYATSFSNMEEDLIEGVFMTADEGQYLTLFPNPARETLTIETKDESAQPAQITITTVTGQVVFNANTSSGRTTINVSGLARGLYFVEVKGENAFRGRFVVE